MMNEKERERLEAEAFSYSPGVKKAYLTLVKNYGQKIGDNYLRLTTNMHTLRPSRKKLPDLQNRRLP